MLRTLRPKFNIENMPLMIFVNKGIEVGSNALTLEIITDTCGPEVAEAAAFIVGSNFCFVAGIRPITFLQSGPSFAKERKLISLSCLHLVLLIISALIQSLTGSPLLFLWRLSLRSRLIRLRRFSISLISDGERLIQYMQVCSTD